jgi:hypothetical protein
VLIYHHLDAVASHHRQQLLREAENERLAGLAQPRRSSIRTRVAAGLVALAQRLDDTTMVPSPYAVPLGDGC